MAYAAGLFSGFFKALVFVAVFLLASATPSRSAPSPSKDFSDHPVVLMSLQDQCLSRAERSAAPDRMRAICIGWALLAIEGKGGIEAKADALRAACLREVQFGGDGEIREYRAQGEALCKNLHASITR
jgi:hypothetical protein